MRKYDVGGAQGRYQADSNQRVLENKLGITDPDERDQAELVLLEKLYELVLVKDLSASALRVADLKTWHRQWLGNLYDWAGVERSVNMSKGDFHFAAASFRCWNLLFFAFKRASMTLTGTPVSIAVELATARRMRLRSADSGIFFVFMEGIPVLEQHAHCSNSGEWMMQLKGKP